MKIEKKPEKTYDKEISELHNSLKSHKNYMLEFEKKLNESFKVHENESRQFIQNLFNFQIIEVFKRYDHKLKNDLMIDEEQLNEKEIADLFQGDSMNPKSTFPNISIISGDQNKTMLKTAIEEKQEAKNFKYLKAEIHEANKLSDQNLETNKVNHENIGLLKKDFIEKIEDVSRVSRDSNDIKIKLKNYDYSNQSESKIRKFQREKKSDLKIKCQEISKESSQNIEQINLKSNDLYSNKITSLTKKNNNTKCELENLKKSDIGKTFEDEIEKAKQIIETVKLISI